MEDISNGKCDSFGTFIKKKQKKVPSDIQKQYASLFEKETYFYSPPSPPSQRDNIEIDCGTYRFFCHAFLDLFGGSNNGANQKFARDAWDSVMSVHLEDYPELSEKYREHSRHLFGYETKTGGHAITIDVGPDSYLFINSGSGVKNHPKKIEEGNEYYNIPLSIKNNAPEEFHHIIKKAIEKWGDQNNQPSPEDLYGIFLRFFQGKIVDSSNWKNIKGDLDYTIQNLRKGSYFLPLEPQSISTLNNEEFQFQWLRGKIMDGKIWGTTQMSGSCTFYSLFWHSIARLSLHNKNITNFLKTWGNNALEKSRQFLLDNIHKEPSNGTQLRFSPGYMQTIFKIKEIKENDRQKISNITTKISPLIVEINENNMIFTEISHWTLDWTSNIRSFTIDPDKKWVWMCYLIQTLKWDNNYFTSLSYKNQLDMFYNFINIYNFISEMGRRAVLNESDIFIYRDVSITLLVRLYQCMSDKLKLPSLISIKNDEIEKKDKDVRERFLCIKLPTINNIVDDLLLVEFYNWLVDRSQYLMTTNETRSLQFPLFDDGYEFENVSMDKNGWTPKMGGADLFYSDSDANVSHKIITFSTRNTNINMTILIGTGDIICKNCKKSYDFNKDIKDIQKIYIRKNYSNFMCECNHKIGEGGLNFYFKEEDEDKIYEYKKRFRWLFDPILLSWMCIFNYNSFDITINTNTNEVVITTSNLSDRFDLLLSLSSTYVNDNKSIERQFESCTWSSSRVRTSPDKIMFFPIRNLQYDLDEDIIMFPRDNRFFLNQKLSYEQFSVKKIEEEWLNLPEKEEEWKWWCLHRLRSYLLGVEPQPVEYKSNTCVPKDLHPLYRALTTDISNVEELIKWIEVSINQFSSPIKSYLAYYSYLWLCYSPNKKPLQTLLLSFENIKTDLKFIPSEWQCNLKGICSTYESGNNICEYYEKFFSLTDTFEGNLQKCMLNKCNVFDSLVELLPDTYRMSEDEESVLKNFAEKINVSVSAHRSANGTENDAPLLEEKIVQNHCMLFIINIYYKKSLENNNYTSNWLWFKSIRDNEILNIMNNLLGYYRNYENKNLSNTEESSLFYSSLLSDSIDNLIAKLDSYNFDYLDEYEYADKVYIDTCISNLHSSISYLRSNLERIKKNKKHVDFYDFYFFYFMRDYFNGVMEACNIFCEKSSIMSLRHSVTNEIRELLSSEDVNKTMKPLYWTRDEHGTKSLQFPELVLKDEVVHFHHTHHKKSHPLVNRYWIPLNMNYDDDQLFYPVSYDCDCSEQPISKLEFLHPSHRNWHFQINPQTNGLEWIYKNETYYVKPHSSPWLAGLEKEIKHTACWSCENRSGTYLIFACAQNNKNSTLINKNPIFDEFDNTEENKEKNKEENKEEKIELTFHTSTLRWIRLTTDEQFVDKADSIETFVWLYGIGVLYQQDVITRRLFPRMLSILTWYAHTPDAKTDWYTELCTWFNNGWFGSGASALMEMYVGQLSTNNYFDCLPKKIDIRDTYRADTQNKILSQPSLPNAVMPIGKKNFINALHPFYRRNSIPNYSLLNNEHMCLSTVFQKVFLECVMPYRKNSLGLIKSIKSTHQYVLGIYISEFDEWQNNTYHRPDPIYPYLLDHLTFEENDEEYKRALYYLKQLWRLVVLKWMVGILTDLVNAKSIEDMERPIKFFNMESWYGFDISDKESEIKIKRTVFQMMFEITSGFIMRKDQFKKATSLICDLTRTDPNATREVHEIIMGAGKSAVLVPYIVFYFTLFTNTKNILLIQPSHLKEACASILMRVVMPWFSGPNVNIVRLVSALHCKTCMEESTFWLANSFKLCNIIVASDIDWKKQYLQCRLMGIWNRIDSTNSMIVVMDEYDSMYTPSTSEFNLSLEKTDHSIGKITNNIDHWRNWYSDTLYGLVYGDPNVSAYITDVLDSTQKLHQRHFKKLKDDYRSLKHGMQLNRHYGWGSDGSPLAVPYIAVNTPAKGSLFSDTDIRLLLTVMIYKTFGIREIDLEKLKDDWKIYKDDLYLDWERLGYDDYKFRYDPDIIKKFIKKDVILFYTGMVTSQFNLSFVDLLDRGMCSQMAGFSGTTAFKDVTFGWRWQNNIVFKGSITEASTTKMIEEALTKTDMIRISRMEEYKDEMDDTELFLNTVFHNDEYPKEWFERNKCIALIDSASWIRLTSLEKVSSLILNYTEQKGLKNVQIRYFNERDKLVCAPEGACSTDSYEDNVNYFIIFDQKHTVGTDIPLPPVVHGFLTTGIRSRWSDIAQAAFRLRGLGSGHTVQMVVHPDFNDMKEDMPETNMELCTYFKNIQDKNQRENELYYYRQCIRTSERIHHNYEKNKYQIYISHPSESETPQEFVELEFKKDGHTDHIDPFLLEKLRESATNSTPGTEQSVEFEQQKEQEQEQEQEQSISGDIKEGGELYRLKNIPNIRRDDIFKINALKTIVDYDYARTKINLIEQIQRKFNLEWSPLLWYWMTGFSVSNESTLYMLNYKNKNKMDQRVCPLIQLSNVNGKTWWITIPEWRRIGCPPHDKLSDVIQRDDMSLYLFLLLSCFTFVPIPTFLSTKLIDFIDKSDNSKDIKIWSHMVLGWFKYRVNGFKNIISSPFLEYIKSQTQKLGVLEMYDYNFQSKLTSRNNSYRITVQGPNGNIVLGTQPGDTIQSVGEYIEKNLHLFFGKTPSRFTLMYDEKYDEDDEIDDNCIFIIKI